MPLARRAAPAARMMPAYVPPSPTAIRRPLFASCASASNIPISWRCASPLIPEAPPLKNTNSLACLRSEATNVPSAALESGAVLETEIRSCVGDTGWAAAVAMAIAAIARSAALNRIVFQLSNGFDSQR